MCMIDDSDGFPSVYGSHIRTARQTHKCSECGRLISKGELYEVASGLWDGEWSNYKTCRHCQVARKWLDTYCGGSCHGDIESDLKDHYEGDDFCLARLIVGMRNGWKIRGKLMRTPVQGGMPNEVA